MIYQRLWLLLRYDARDDVKSTVVMARALQYPDSAKIYRNLQLAETDEIDREFYNTIVGFLGGNSGDLHTRYKNIQERYSLTLRCPWNSILTQA